MSKTTDPEMIGWEFNRQSRSAGPRESIPSVGWPNSYLYDAANGLRSSLHLATSCEAEWAFSGCKYTISDHRSRLGEDVLEALVCDGAWLRAGL
jgi:hypothetical protein